MLPLSARLAQLVEHMLDVHGVTGSSPVPRTIKETSFVYQGKRGFLLLSTADYAIII